MLAKINTQFKWTLLGLGIGLVFLFLSLRDIDVDAVLDNLYTIKILPAVMAVAAGTLFMLIKSLRWKLILNPVVHVDFSKLHSAVYIGTAANLIIVHSGEVLRSTLIGKQAQVAVSAVLASVGVERIFDFMVVVVLFGVLLISSEKLPDYVTAAGFIAIFMVVAGLIAIFVLMVPSKTRRNIRLMVIRYFPEKLSNMIRKQLKRSLVGFSTLDSPSLVVTVFLLSIFQWSCIVFGIWLCAYSVGYSATIAMVISVWVLMVIGLTLPSSPAQLGTTQLAFTLGLSIAMNEMQIPFAASVVYTFCMNFPYMIIGAFYWLKVGGFHRES